MSTTPSLEDRLTLLESKLARFTLLSRHALPIPNTLPNTNRPSCDDDASSLTATTTTAIDHENGLGAETDPETQKLVGSNHDRLVVTVSSTGPRVADPSPLGLFAFAITTLLLNFYNASITEDASTALVTSYGIFFGGFLQILAGILDFTNKNVFGGTVFCAYGGFWLSSALYDILAVTRVLPAGGAFPVGRVVCLLIWALFTGMLLGATLRMNRVTQATFLAVAISLLFSAGGVYNKTCQNIAGVIGIVAGALAFYSGYAALLKGVYGREILPLGDCSRPSDVPEDLESQSPLSTSKSARSKRAVKRKSEEK
ncbi:hypothetical protein HK102_003432 [Quaeritorhiza haematococci]|nr:hypothetical protein HK102_003432 [Quaeritorhiza haematococci]